MYELKTWIYLSIAFKIIHSPERVSSKIHPKYFIFACCLIPMPSYAIFKASHFEVYV